MQKGAVHINTQNHLIYNSKKEILRTSNYKEINDSVYYSIFIQWNIIESSKMFKEKI